MQSSETKQFQIILACSAFGMHEARVNFHQVIIIGPCSVMMVARILRTRGSHFHLSRSDTRRLHIARIIQRNGGN